MRHNRTYFVFALLLVFTVVLFSTSCEKLDANKLKANYHFSKANQLFKDGKFRTAMTEYERTLKYNPDMMQAYRFLGESYKSLYKVGVDTPENQAVADKALEAFKKALDVEPDNKEIIFSLGDMYDKLKNFEEAEKLYLHILELEPGNMGNYYVVAEFYKRYAAENEELRAKAESMYLRRIELDPENPQGYAYVANYFENLAPAPEVYDQAAKYWDMRIALEPESPEAWLAKGVNRWSRSYRFQNLPAADRLKTAQEALQALEKANELDPEYPEPYSWLSVLYQSVLIKLEPDKEARYKAEADRAMERWNDMRKRAAERKKLEDELKKVG
ncbi:MAG: tetratricopeptide repeat protein [Candidatus Aminicenantes bacterium]|nr:tetratricopeptide repeat protein [Candidatus Aminicenantes bacterium]